MDLFQIVFTLVFLLMAFGFYGNVRRTRIATEKIADRLSPRRLPQPPMAQPNRAAPWPKKARISVAIGLVLTITLAVLYSLSAHR
jgi:hypothetical protein